MRGLSDRFTAELWGRGNLPEVVFAACRISGNQPPPEYLGTP